MAQGLLSKGTKLLMKATGSTYENLEDLMSVPELGAEKEKVEVTCLADSAKRYINGIGDFGDLSFKFLYDATEASSYRKLKAVEDADAVKEFKIELPDGVSIEFTAGVSTKIEAVEVNGALTFNASLTLNSDMNVVFPQAELKKATK